MKFLLNSPVLTSYGTFEFRRATLVMAQGFMAEGACVSAIGHKGAADFLSGLLGVKVPENRISVRMEIGDQALVLRLVDRLPEGKVLSPEELAAVKYELGILERIPETRKAMVMKAFTSDGRRPLVEYQLGERYSYINDRLYAPGTEHTRTELSEPMAEEMARMAGYQGALGNKDYVCVHVDPNYEKRTFVYAHDFSYWLYIVWPKRD